jgi:hypothetical protein
MRNIEIQCGNNDNLAVYKYTKAEQPPATYDWGRPESWLEIPNVAVTDEVIYFLYPVTNTDYNAATITVQGDYIVDWGDGIVENFSSGTSASHNYLYSSIPSSTDTPFGYRQAIIKVTPQAGASLTQIGNIINSSFLEIAASGPNLVVQSISNNLTLSAIKILCKIAGQIQGNGLRAIELDYNVFSLKSDLSGVFSFNRSLQYVSNFNTFSFTNFGSLFFDCFSLLAFPEINMSNATNITSMCSGCSSMVYFPTTNFISNVTSLSAAFNNCGSLRSINLTGTITQQPVTTFTGASSLFEYPELNLEQITGSFTFQAPIRRIKAFGGKASTSFSANSVIGRAQLVEFFQNLGSANSGATINITNCFGTPSLSAGDRLIATNKGFTLIG